MHVFAQNDNDITRGILRLDFRERFRFREIYDALTFAFFGSACDTGSDHMKWMDEAVLRGPTVSFIFLKILEQMRDLSPAPITEVEARIAGEIVIALSSLLELEIRTVDVQYLCTAIWKLPTLFGSRCRTGFVSAGPPSLRLPFHAAKITCVTSMDLLLDSISRNLAHPVHKKVRFCLKPQGRSAGLFIYQDPTICFYEFLESPTFRSVSALLAMMDSEMRVEKLVDGGPHLTVRFNAG